MKKFVAYCISIIFMAICMISTPILEERANDTISKIREFQVKETKPEKWDWVVDFCKNTETEPFTNGYEICSLVEHFEEQRNNRSVYHDAIIIHCYREFLVENDAQLEILDYFIDSIVKAFESKTGQNVFVEKKYFDNHIGLGCRYTFESQACSYVAAQVLKVGDTGVAKANFGYGIYFERAEGDGTGKHWYIGNDFVSENDQITVNKVAYLNDDNEVIEMSDKTGTYIDCSKKRMLLVQKEETVLGWFYPENVVTE